ncbi:28S ribosomal protein S30, mitochondrial [Microplitis mediator]|uniref:28S ribosomal protein S30, mitochondrial n=1 Tax=Microplitis mediator TaxID=375433 RepID=UPI00255288FD|nr:28S ribosomal protein S30, mitochondrial [Microplitis mediator]
MLLIKIHSRSCVKYSPVVTCIRNSQSDTSNVADSVKSPVYPPILDISVVPRWQRKLELWHEQVKQLPTPEEKLIKVNMPRYWGFKCLMVHEGSVYYNELPQAQYITRTHIIDNSSLPSYYDNLMSPEKLNSLTENLKQLIEDGVAFEFRNQNQSPGQQTKDTPDKPDELDDIVGSAVSKQVNRLMLSALAKDYPHLMGIEIDYDPRIEAGWFFGGINMTRETRISLLKNKLEEALNEPIDREFQYLGSPIFQLRHQHPLKEILTMAECENPEFEVPVVKLDPRTFGHYIKRRHLTTLPGFWPGDPSEFGFMSYHKRGYLLRRPKDLNDEIDVLKTQAVFSNYAWLLSQACHLGFSTFNDITYPLVNQMIITNGQYWSFCVYQLNTTAVNQRNADENPKRNLCWITEPIKLYEKVENNKLIGFNDEVIKNLIKFYVNTPEERVGVDMKPYLGKEEQRVADIQDKEKRIWLEKRYKHLMSARPRHLRMPELYHWQKIYKFIFNTRPLDKRRTPWDYGINPYLRRLDNHCPDYIPKALRPEGKAKKIKFAKTYYPK